MGVTPVLFSELARGEGNGGLWPDPKSPPLTAVLQGQNDGGHRERLISFRPQTPLTEHF